MRCVADLQQVPFVEGWPYRNHPLCVLGQAPSSPLGSSLCPDLPSRSVPTKSFKGRSPSGHSSFSALLPTSAEGPHWIGLITDCHFGCAADDGPLEVTDSHVQSVPWGSRGERETSVCFQKQKVWKDWWKKPVSKRWTVWMHRIPDNSRLRRGEVLLEDGTICCHTLCVCKAGMWTLPSEFVWCSAYTRYLISLGLFSVFIPSGIISQLLWPPDVGGPTKCTISSVDGKKIKIVYL